MPPGASQGDGTVSRSSSSRKRRRSSSTGGTWPKKRSYKKWKSASSARQHKFRKVCYPLELTVAGANPTFTDKSSYSTGSSGAGQTDDFNTTQFGLSQYFIFKQIPNWGEFAGMFDQYRIDKVELRCIYQNNTASVSTAGVKTGPLPILYWTQDFDDATVPSGQSVVLEYGATNMKVMNANEPFSIFLKPNVLRQLYQGVTSGYESVRPTKVDVGYLELPHYGMKYWVRNWFDGMTTSDVNAKLTIQPIFHITMFNDR